MLEIENLHVQYGSIEALHGISLNVKPGEMVALLGANGAGKSTTLMSIMRLPPPEAPRVTRGRITYNGIDLLPVPPHLVVARHKIGLVPEGRRVFGNLTVLENLKLGAYNTNARAKEDESLDYVLKLFPRLKERMDKQAQTLSGGEARMLAIGRGLMSNAKFLAIDEPSLGLAPNLRAEVFKKISDINKGGITVLMVEQDITEASEYADRIYLVEDGRIVFEGTEEEVSKNEHVREVFLGI